MTAKRVTPAPPVAPRAANQQHIDAQLERSRLLLQRHIRWLRTQWHEDGVGEYRGLVISDAKADRLLEGARSAARAAFFAEDRECIAIGKRLDRLGSDINRLSRRMAAAGTPSAVDRLTTLFALTPFERDTLLLAAAPALDASIGPLLAYAQDTADRAYATPHLAIELFADPPDTAAAMRDAFASGATLRRLRLLTLQPMPPSLTVLAAALRVDERIVDYLRGLNTCDPRVLALLRPVAEVPIAPPYAVLGDQLSMWTAQRLDEGYWPLINITDSSSASACDIGRATCERLGLRMMSLELGDALAAADDARDDLLHLLQRESALLRHAYFVAHPTSASLSFAERVGALVIVASLGPLRSDREMISVAAPRLDASGQRECWNEALGANRDRLGGTIDLLVEQFNFGPRDIHRTAAAARRRAELRALGSGAGIVVSGKELWCAAREEAGQTIDDLAQHVVPAHTFDDLVLPTAVFSQLEEITAQVKHRARVYEAWGFGARLSRGRATSACFAGPTGCGKTAAAEALAHRLQLPLYRVDLAGVVSKYIGETEKNLRRVFDAAEQSGAILFFDEADALFGKRTEVKDSHDRYANIEVNYLLQRLEDYRGLGILATNRKTAIDRAFLRRLRFLVDFPFPDVDSRRRIWRQVFPAQALVGALDYEQLAQMEIAGGNIKNIAVNAAFLAAADGGDAGSPISMRHILRAAEREYAKIDKALSAPELAVPRGVVGA